jgi:6-phosphogluconate dehydrogenase
MMPGGAKEAVKKLLPLFKKMSASDGNGGRCVSYVGEGGSGHFVKMVHNGIEYSLMQAIAETYDFLRSAAKYSNKDLHRVFSQWSSKGDLRGYLMEITADIFLQKDEYSKHDLLDVIADTAAQKGTGKWTTETAMSVGVAVPCINAAVDARILSGAKDLRLNKRKMLKARSIKKAVLSKKEAEHIAKDALSLTYLTCYAQGFELMARVSMERNWNIDLSEVARLWRGGCIIRSALLPELQNAHRDGPMGMKATKKLFQKYSGSAQKNWRGMLVIAISKGVPMPVHCAAIAFFDSLCKERLPQNLIQAQRDYFGSHTYQRIDRPGTFHTVWSHTI